MADLKRETTERFITWWPVQANLVHIRDLRSARPFRGMCGSWEYYADDCPYEIPEGEEYLLCATCTKIRARREQT